MKAATRAPKDGALSIFERVLAARDTAHTQDIADLEQLIRRRSFVPDKEQRERLFEVAAEVGLLEVVQEVFGADYTTWLDTDLRNDHDRELMAQYGEGPDGVEP